MGMRRQKQQKASDMTTYRMYFRKTGEIRGREDFEADDDVAAIRIARVLYDACADVCDCFELWQGTRQLRTRQPHHQHARLNDLIEAHQRVTLETEEHICQSRWTIAQSRRLIEAVDRLTARYK
jgi:hypothetical protein